MNNELVNITQGAFKFAVQLVQQPADAYDILQDAATIAISNPNAPKPDSDTFKPWFYRVVRNKAIDRFRQLNRYQYDEFNDETESASNDFNPEFLHHNEQLQRDIKNALASISAEHRDVILLKDSHGFSYKEISQILDIPEGSVMSKLHRARQNLKVKLSESFKQLNGGKV